MITYLLQVAICWGLFLGLYHLTLRKETFFVVNSAYLLLTIVLGLAIPRMTWDTSMFMEQPTIEVAIDFMAVSFDQFTSVVTPEVEPESIGLLAMIYWLGVLLMMAKLAYGITRILWMRYQAEITMDGDQAIAYTSGDHAPFTFFGTIYLGFDSAQPADETNPETMAERSRSRREDPVLIHESAHVSGWHTLDVLFVEVVKAFFWFNPLVYGYDHALKTVHEYIADANVLQRTALQRYGRLLLRQAQPGLEIALANHFYNTQLKKRFKMMTRTPSQKRMLLKYLSVLPFILVVSLVFTNQKVQAEISKVEEINLEELLNINKVDPLDLVIRYSTSTESDSWKKYAGINDDLHTLLADLSETEKKELVDKINKYSEEFNTDLVARYTDNQFAIGFETGYGIGFLYPEQEIRINTNDSEFSFSASDSITYNESKKEIHLFGDVRIGSSSTSSGDRINYTGLHDINWSPESQKPLVIAKTNKPFELKILDESKTAVYSNTFYHNNWNGANTNGNGNGNIIKEGTYHYIAKLGKEHTVEGKLNIVALSTIDSIPVIEELYYKKSEIKKGAQVKEEIIYLKDLKTGKIRPIKTKRPFDSEPGLEVSDTLISFDPDTYEEIKEVRIRKPNNAPASGKLLDNLKIIDSSHESGDTIITYDSKTYKKTIQIVPGSKQSDEKIFKVVEVKPEFPGGQQALFQYIFEQLKYPDLARKNGVEGNAVIGFVIEKDGIMSNLTMRRDPGAGLGAEALRVINIVSDNKVWQPGKQGGKAVRVQYNLPIRFKLDKKEEKEEEVFEKVEELPEYPNGEKALLNAISKHLVYPTIASSNNVEGTCIIGFIVEKDGSVTSTMTRRDAGASTGSAANQAVSKIVTATKWIPGKQNGKPVRVLYNIPIRFKLSDGNKGNTVIALPQSELNSPTLYGPTTKKPETPKEISTEDLTIFNMFSPNGDGINDGFTIIGIEAFDNNQVQVFNKWGNKVFSQTNYTNDNEWEGDWNGKDVPDGTYFYLISDNDKNSLASGYVQILRIADDASKDKQNNLNPIIVIHDDKGNIIYNLMGVNVDKINPNDIKQINVVKGEKATDKYGDKGTNGVVEIYMKPGTVEAPKQLQSKVRSDVKQMRFESVKIFPNPVEDNLTIILVNPHKQTSYMIHTLDGKLVKQGKLSENKFKGELKVEVPANQFPTGILVVTIIEGDKVYSQPIVKK